MGNTTGKGTIVYIGGFELPDKNAAAHRVLNNGKLLRELGYEVVFIGIGHDIQETTAEEYQGFMCWSVPYPVRIIQWMRYLSSTKTLKTVVHQLENVKGIIFYNYQALALAKGIHFCKKRNIWSIVDVTEWYVAPKSNPVFWAIKQLDTAVRMRFLNKKADGIIAISKFLYDYYKKDDKRHIIQLPPLVDKQEAKWSGEIWRENRGYIRLIYAGSTSDMKDNLGIVLESIFPYREKIHMQIVGIDEDDLRMLLPDNLYDKYVGKHVEVCGRKSHLECLEMIKACDFQIFVRPKNLVTEAGFPTKLGESFACGTPVITNLSSNVDDVLIENENGFVLHETSSDSVAETMSRIAMIEKSEIARLRSNCKKNNYFDYKQYVDKMKQLIEKIYGDRDANKNR